MARMISNIVFGLYAGLLISCGQSMDSPSTYQPLQTVVLDLYPCIGQDSVRAEGTITYDGESTPHLYLDDMIIVSGLGSLTDTFFSNWNRKLYVKYDSAITLKFVSNKKVIATRVIHVPPLDKEWGGVSIDSSTFKIPPLKYYSNETTANISLLIYCYSPWFSKRRDHSYFGDRRYSGYQDFGGLEISLPNEFSLADLDAADSVECSARITTISKVDHGDDQYQRNTSSQNYTKIEYFEVRFHREYFSKTTLPIYDKWLSMK